MATLTNLTAVYYFMSRTVPLVGSALTADTIQLTVDVALTADATEMS